MEKKITRKQQAENTKKKLLTISFELIREFGFDSVTIQQICQKADVSTGAFYHHLGSKAGIIKEGYLQCDAYFEEIVQSKLTGHTFCEKILQYIGYQMQYAEEMGIDLMIQIYKAQITESNAFFLSEQRSLPKGLFELIHQAQQNGELTDQIACKDLGNEILIISRGLIYNWCQRRGQGELLPLSQKIIGQYLRSYQC